MFPKASRILTALWKLAVFEEIVKLMFLSCFSFSPLLHNFSLELRVEKPQVCCWFIQTNLLIACQANLIERRSVWLPLLTRISAVKCAQQAQAHFSVSIQIRIEPACKSHIVFEGTEKRKFCQLLEIPNKKETHRTVPPPVVTNLTRGGMFGYCDGK